MRTWRRLTGQHWRRSATGPFGYDSPHGHLERGSLCWRTDLS
ncbi:hypothetical protein AB0I81_00455 [Nonomuraea sp. NPDC050404]